MKWILLILVAIVGGIVVWNYAKPGTVKQTIKTIENKVNPKPISQSQQKQYIFVPYWSFTKSIVTDSDFALIYFGLGVNDLGVNKEEDGYLKLKTFANLTPNATERILAIRMTDKFVNAQVLKNLEVQEKIASEAVNLATENGFDGVLLDYETSAFGFDTTTNNISSFYKVVSQKVKSSNLLFYTTVYGDTYFRARPYDIKKIGELSDKVLIMAYDFSKSRGNPGPNFPLKETEEYGYSFERMISDFQKDVDNRKLVVTLGYFGYDWQVGGDGTAVASGVPLSTNKIIQDFVNDCAYDSCNLERDPSTQEPSIKYLDADGNRHAVWFEDTKSADVKKQFLKSKGILEIADWAYSYN